MSLEFKMIDKRVLKKVRTFDYRTIVLSGFQTTDSLIFVFFIVYSLLLSMYLSITLIRLKHPKHIYTLVSEANEMLKRMSDYNCKGVKTRGFWKNHYTMTLWENEDDIKRFNKSELHQNSIKGAKKIASEIRIVRIESKHLIKWKEAKQLLEKGKVYKY